MSQSRPGWSARRVSQPGYLVATVLVALTGLVLAAGNDWWWGGFLLSGFALVMMGYSIHARRRRPQS
jgi:4-hydroxybenzoate polyprenyltransferase